MTDYGNWLLLTIMLPIIAFALGILWNEVGRQVKEEMIVEEQKKPIRTGMRMSR